MNHLVALLLRMFVMLFAYGLAALAASAFLHLVAWPLMREGLEEAPWALVGGIGLSIPLIGLFVAYFGFLPAVVAIGISEAFAFRSWLYYALSGAAGGIFALIIAYGASIAMIGAAEDIARNDKDIPLGERTETALAVVGGGIVAGLVYWAIAGRNARRWLPEASAPAPSGS